MNLTERQREILFAIIEQYSELATPVGSVTLAKLFDVSSATIRAEMARLEAFGLIAHPYTSAGRIPTDAGYRLYVNTLVEESEEDFASYPSERLVAAELTHSPSSFEEATTQSFVELPRLAPPAPGSRAASESKKPDRAFHALEVRVASQTDVEKAIRSAVDALVELTGNLGLGTVGNQLYLSGISRLFTQPEFSDLSRVQAVAKLLDDLEPWLKEASPGEPLNIFIGNENPIGKTSGVSLIISRFHSPFSDNSYIGVLGPTRQNYQRVMSLVRCAGEILERGF